MTDGDTLTCPSCGQLSSASSTWCEACGHELAAVPKQTCVACGEQAVESDGYCHSCGHGQPKPRDHVEVVDGPVSAVSDRGLRHHHNEDAVAVVQVDDDTAVLVVCDGVSSTPGSAEISALAATTTAESLGAAAAEGGPPEGMAVSTEALEAAVRSPQVETGTASLEMEIDEFNPPSTTLVAAVARRRGGSVMVSVVWLGDSRVYWIDGDGAHLLTVDHEIDGALTRWVGVDASHHLPQTAHHEFPLGGDADLVVCSDGLWRYFAPELGEPADELLARLRGDGLDGVDLVRAMVDHANERGGHDNISVAHWAPGSPDQIAGTTVEATDRPPAVDVANDDADDDPTQESKESVEPKESESKEPMS